MPSTFFAPELYINSGASDISFYEHAFAATVNFRLANDDGSIHVAELVIDGCIFHIHEVGYNKYFVSPQQIKSSTVCIGLFVDDVDAVMKKAIEAGAIEVSPARTYEYGYRQGTVADPFGHHWQIQKKML